MYTYARINKNTLRFVREQKSVSFDYINRITKFPETKVLVWEDISSDKFPTINQAKALAKCYRVPFAGLYMNVSDIDVRHIPPMRNLRTLPDALIDDSALNLAIADVLGAKELFVEVKSALKEIIPKFSISISAQKEEVRLWAYEIRKQLQLDSSIQYRCQSARKLYLYVRDQVERAGVFIHCFTGVDVETVRGFALYDDNMPVIGINNEDRYPAKTFSIIHELVHLIKRNTAICNQICNAVAGEVLVPKILLEKQLGSYIANEIDYDIVEALAAKFSVSKEVICRRLLDIGKILRYQYEVIMNTVRIKFESEKEAAKELRKVTGQGIPRNISREAIDQNSAALCRVFYHGYREGIFDKQDLSRYLGINQSHIDKFIAEVSRW